jgi:hypothetical protein
MSNYRPISLLTTFSAILEKVMYSSLRHYLHTNNILVPEQLCFRKGISTENAAFKLTDSVLKFLNQKMHVNGIFCDLAKAFNCVNHEILLSKLQYFCIQGAMASLFRSYHTCTPWALVHKQTILTERPFRSYHTERKQKIEIKSPYATQSTYSSWGTIDFGAFAFHNLYK